MKSLSGRAFGRIFRHHLILFPASALAVFLLYWTLPSGQTSFRLSFATAYVGLALLAVTLSAGPLSVLTKRRNPVSTDLRRDAGIWCGIISIVHVAAGLQVHMQGNILLYFFNDAAGIRGLFPRLDLFGFANYTGLVGVIVISLLLLLSNDYSLRTLKSRRWKSLQRLNYGVFALVVLHGVAYQVIENRQVIYVLLFVIIVLTVLALQITGFTIIRKNKLKASAADACPDRSG